MVADRALKTLGTTWTQWAALTFLSRKDGQTQIALAAELELTRVAVGDLLNRMEAAELVERRADHADARSRRVYLTRSGRRMFDKYYNHIEALPAVMMHPVSDEDLTATVRVLGQIKGILLELMEEKSSPQTNNSKEDIDKSFDILST